MSKTAADFTSGQMTAKKENGKGRPRAKGEGQSGENRGQTKKARLGADKQLPFGGS